MSSDQPHNADLPGLQSFPSAAAAGPVAVVLGTRPEIVKLAEIISILGPRVLLVHTGQHWDHAMSGALMASLSLPKPDVFLSVGGGTRAEQIASTLTGVAHVLEDQPVAAVVVQGDTNSVLGGALAANACGVPLVHVEAGLRSFDRRMPEEHNRVATDHLADLCLAPTDHSRDLLLAEGVAEERIVVTGNTVVSAVTRALGLGQEIAEERMRALDLPRDDFVLATVHRPENTASREQLSAVLTSLGTIAGTLCPVVLPLHPAARRRAHEFGLTHLLEPLLVVEPLGYEEFVCLSARAAFTISDSGGVQEESSVWKRPVIVLRRSTERPEVLGTFAHLMGPGPDLVALSRDLFTRRHEVAHELAALPSPFGDITAAQQCVDAIDEMLART